MNLDRREYFLADIPLTEWTRTVGVVSPLWELLAQPLPPRPIHEILKLPEPRNPVYVCSLCFCLTVADADLRGRYRKTQGNKIGLLHLPEELLGATFDQVDDVQDAICLSLVNKVFATLGGKRVHALMSAQAGVWIGHRVIRVRRDVPAASLKGPPMVWPDGVFTEDDKRDLENFVRKRENRRGNSGWKIVMSRFFRKNFKQINPVHRAFVDFAWFGKKLCGQESQVFEEWGWPRYYGVGQEDKDWVLCNLTTKEYVRDEELKKVAEGLKVDESAVTLAHALMSRSYCVKSEDSLHPERAVRLACWAGDRFEITTVSRMQACGSGKDWEDVSSSLSSELLKQLACPKKE